MNNIIVYNHVHWMRVIMLVGKSAISLSLNYYEFSKKQLFLLVVGFLQRLLKNYYLHRRNLNLI